MVDSDPSRRNAMQTRVCALKSFGDFVIALDSIARCEPSADAPAPALLAGRHLHELASALDSGLDVHYVGDATWTDVPAAFDVGKRGKAAALRNLLDVRRRLGEVAAGRLVFDRVGWRERFIGGAHALIGLPGAANVYLAYDELLAALGHRLGEPPMAGRPPIRSAVIVPGSRLIAKVLPPESIADCHAVLSARGIDVRVVTLAGEQVPVPAGLHVLTLPRRFDALLAALRDTDLVVSADSLSAHLAGHIGRATFVVTPIANRYWLPRSAYRDAAWALFGETAPLSAWLDRPSPAPHGPHASEQTRPLQHLAR